MSPRQLKALIQTGHYRMEPALVAEAMLERPGIRALLVRETDAASSIGQTRAALYGRRAH